MADAKVCDRCSKVIRGALPFVVVSLAGADGSAQDWEMCSGCSEALERWLRPLAEYPVSGDDAVRIELGEAARVLTQAAQYEIDEAAVPAQDEVDEDEAPAARSIDDEVEALYGEIVR